jgi:hypothetical protein
MILTLIGMLTWGGLLEPNMIQVSKLEIILNNVSPLVEKLKFVQISDIHFKHFSKREKILINKLKNIEPDYVFLCGDLVDWTTKNLEDLDLFLKELKKIPKFKTFFVFGNHEHRNKEKSRIVELLKENKIKILKNEHFQLEDNFYLLGVDDPHSGFDDLKKAKEGINLDSPKILLAHSPEVFRKVDFSNVLVLTGHTHGGQINIPFFVKLILPLKYDKKYISGLFGKNHKWLYVNRGIGFTFLPFRINSRPEIAVIKIKND